MALVFRPFTGWIGGIPLIKKTPANLILYPGTGQIYGFILCVGKAVKGDYGYKKKQGNSSGCSMEH